MSYDIPLFDLTVGREEEQAVIETIRSNWISIGPKCTEFENLFSDMFKVDHALTLSNCTVALHLALKLIGVDQDDEVICPSLTFVATVNAIKYLNAKPVFADIHSLKEPVISSDTIRPLITSKTKAIMLMHYAGYCCDMDSIMGLAKEHNLKVIEDACHAPMSEYKGKKLGTFGDIGCFSFFSNKNISTGEGGMMITNNKKYYERGKLLRSHGMTTLSYQRASGHAVSYDVVEPGYNYRMDDIRASIGIVQLKKLEYDLKKRAQVRKWYIQNLKEIEKVLVPFEEHNQFSSNYIFPIVIEGINKIQRDNIRNLIHQSGIQTSMHYPPVHMFSSYKSSTKLNNTEKYGDQSITLPMYSALSESNVIRICDTIKEHLSEGFD